jgi:YVTN family beta-propeller protein
MRATLFYLAMMSCWAALAVEPQSRIIRDGVVVEFSVRPFEPGRLGPGELRQGTDAVFRFLITDAATGTRISGLQPMAWMELLPDGLAVDPDLCSSRVQSLLGGNLFSRADLSLNAYYVIVMNQDATLTVVDPLFGFGNTKLLALIPLKSPAEDWALTEDQNRLFVSQPGSHTVSAIDTASWKVVRNIDVRAAPSRIGLQPDNQYLWVAVAGGVTAISTSGLRMVARIPTGAGDHDLAFSSDSHFLFVTNREAGSVSVIDVRKLVKKGDVVSGPQPISITFSALSQRAWVAHASGLVSSIDGARTTVMHSEQTDAGISQIRFEPLGRWGFILNPEKNLLSVLDAASGLVVQTGKMEGGPDRVTFSDKLAYVRRRYSESVYMIPLADVGVEGRPLSPADFPGGQHPLGAVSLPTLADSIVQAPGENAVLVANPADRTVYYYEEGMAAPQGQFSNYEREARAVLVINRSLKNMSPGTYETTARLGKPGHYLVPLVLRSPDIVHCFEADVRPSASDSASDQTQQAVHIESDPVHGDFLAGKPIRVRFRLLDPRTGRVLSNMADVRVLITQAFGNHQWRQSASPEGTSYSATFVPEGPGSYYVFVACPSHGLSFSNSQGIQLEVKEK